jgi:hypothetical protein
MHSDTPSNGDGTGRTWPPYWFVLDDDDNPVPVDDLSEWAPWHHKNLHRRQIARTVISDGVCVSTVFVGIDMSLGAGVPKFFETMVFGGEHHHMQVRYDTIGAARAGHKLIVDQLIREQGTG